MLTQAPISVCLATTQPDLCRAFYNDILGVKFVIYDFMEQTEDGIWSVPGNGTQIAWFKELDENVLSISQRV